MSNILDKPITLCLNANWMPIRTACIREAILAMNSVGNGSEDRAAVGLDIQYKQNEDGSYDFSEPLSMIPTKWDDWVNLPIRPFDEFIQTTRFAVRAPTVVIAVHYNKMPNKTFRPSKRTIYERDGGKCQYTGRKLTFKEATLDHVTPRSKGGKDTFENMVLSDAKVNHEKGNKSNKEAGLKLLRQPKAPLPVPAIALIKEARHADWKWFIGDGLGKN